MLCIGPSPLKHTHTHSWPHNGPMACKIKLLSVCVRPADFPAHLIKTVTIITTEIHTGQWMQQHSHWAEHYSTSPSVCVCGKQCSVGWVDTQIVRTVVWPVDDANRHPLCSHFLYRQTDRRLTWWCPWHGRWFLTGRQQWPSWPQNEQRTWTGFQCHSPHLAPPRRKNRNSNEKGNKIRCMWLLLFR